MGVIRRRNPWRSVRAVAFGVLATAFFVYLPAAFISMDSWGSGTPLPTGAVHPPTYLDGLTPPYSGAKFNRSHGFRLPGVDGPALGFGVNNLEFEFGQSEAAWASHTQPIPPYVYIDRWRFGWPIRAFAWETIGCAGGASAADTNAFFAAALGRAGWRHGLDWPAWAPAADLHFMRRVPLIPLWAGLLANVALFALTWAGAGHAVRALRRQHRSRRGQCQWCGYDVGGAVTCTECGSGTPTFSLFPPRRGEGL